MATDLLIADRPARTLDDALARGATTGGWLLSGPKGVGKATVARALVAAHLSGADRLGGADGAVVGLVEAESHPDLQLLRRGVNEKTAKPYTVIRVEDVRVVTERLYRTTATGRRAVVVDTADEMNASSANAMLKSLEEPPAGTLFVLLTRAVGGLLPTIRSRCRVVGLSPIEEDRLTAWLVRRGESEEEARAAARASGGAPGRALSLLEDDAPRRLADDFLAAARGQGDLLRAAQAAGAKANEAAWPEAWQVVTDRLGAALRGADDPLVGPASPALLGALDEARATYERAAGLNADRTHTALVLGRTIGRALRAGR